MSECYKEHYIYNTELRDAASFNDTFLDKESVVYEVIRLINGKPFKLEDNYRRILKSLKIIGLNYDISLSKMLDDIEKLTEANNVEQGNVKYLIFHEGESVSSLVFFIKHYYPTDEQLENGVLTISIREERENPNAKVVNKDLRTMANKLIAERAVFEAILIDSTGNAREGSRTNLFFVKDSIVYTSSDENVLQGTVRKRAIDICNKKAIKLVKLEVNVIELHLYDAAFLTGTSIGVLPIARIDDIKFNVNNEVLKLIQKEYKKILQINL